MRQIYLDYNATTPIAPSVFEAMRPFLVEHYGNPSSQHPLGIAARQAVEDARQRVADALGARPDELFFTSGGTESNNMALLGRAASDGSFRGHLIISAIEHPAVSAPARFLEQWGCDLTVVPVDRFGRVSPDDVEAAIRHDTVLVSVMHANNEVGTLQPIREISHRCQAHGIPVHTDAAQSLGKVRTHVDELGVDLLSVAGHKLYAPKGVGALYIRRSTSLQPIFHGAAHEKGMRPGTENVAAIVALGAAARLAAGSVEENERRLARLRDRLYADLLAGVGPELTLNGPVTGRLPNTLSVNFPRVVGQQLLQRAPEVCASTGSACHSGATHVSDTLSAMGLSGTAAAGTVRLTLGWNTSEEDIQRAASALVGAWESLVAT
jgi:cysteine desulfurase